MSWGSECKQNINLRAGVDGEKTSLNLAVQDELVRLRKDAVVIDLFSLQVVGWSIDDHMRTSLCVRALQMAFWHRKPPPGLLHHSDRGNQNTVNIWR